MYEGFFDIEEELKKLPGKPGVYIMHDKTDEIIYVGKAISLKNRVRQYFQSSRNLWGKYREEHSRGYCHGHGRERFIPRASWTKPLPSS